MSPLNPSLIINTSIVHPDFFILTGLAGIPHKNGYYIFLCFVYIVTLLGNTFVMFMIYFDQCLHSPKYIVVFNLALSDLCGSTTLIPQMVDTFLFKSNVISFETCMSNTFFILVFLSMQSYTLTVLSYDRCVAICFPLRYNEIVTYKSMLAIMAISWIIAALPILIIVILMSRLPFCSNVIKNYFCGQGALGNLACYGDIPSQVFGDLLLISVFYIPVIFITCTYILIGRALLNIATVSERLKAMKTCGAHLILVSMYYLPISFYPALPRTIDYNISFITTSMATILPPMLNPIIYTLNTDEFSETIKKLYRRKTIDVIDRKN